MRPSIKRIFLVLLFAAIAGAAPLAWADHGHGGGGHSGGHGGGHSSGHGGGGWSGGHGHSSYSHYGGYSGFNNHWGGSGRYYSGYRNYGSPYGYAYRPYRNYYRPYSYGLSFYGYPFAYGYYNYPSSYYGYSYPTYSYSYPTDYYVGADDSFSSEALPPQQYVVSRPVNDVARVEFRLPDPQATIWVQGKEMTSSGTVRQFKSPQLDPSQQFTYNVKAEWNNNGQRVADERQVQVLANERVVVDFTQPAQAAPAPRAPAMPELPPPARQPASP